MPSASPTTADLPRFHRGGGFFGPDQTFHVWLSSRRGSTAKEKEDFTPSSTVRVYWHTLTTVCTVGYDYAVGFADWFRNIFEFRMREPISVHLSGPILKPSKTVLYL